MAAILDFLEFCQNGHFFTDIIILAVHTMTTYDNLTINHIYWTLEEAWWPTTAVLCVSLHVNCGETWLYTTVAFYGSKR